MKRRVKTSSCWAWFPTVGCGNHHSHVLERGLGRSQLCCLLLCLQNICVMKGLDEHTAQGSDWKAERLTERTRFAEGVMAVWKVVLAPALLPPHLEVCVWRTPSLSVGNQPTHLSPSVRLGLGATVRAMTVI